MMKQNSTLLATITDKAHATFSGDVVKDIDRYLTHWIATGEAWAKTLREEGLIVTAEAVERHVEWQRKYT